VTWARMPKAESGCDRLGFLPPTVSGERSMAEFDPNVEYRDVQGFPGYRVGSDGSVWSCRTRGTSALFRDGWHQLKPCIRNLRKHKPSHRPALYKRTCLTRDGRQVVVSVHILVCEAFHGPRPKGMFACHDNGNSLDNRAENVLWKTPRENVADAMRHGTHTHGERHPRATITDDIVRKIRQLNAAGEMDAAVSRALNVSRGLARLVRIGLRWTHVV
jgi:hypothetical protein